MARTFDEAGEAAIVAREAERALMVEFQADDATHRAWNIERDLTESVITGGSVTWTGLGARLQLGSPITMAVDLNGETVQLKLDASRINDDADFVGGLMDDTWHQRPVIIREVLFTPNFASVICVVNDWYGIMNQSEFSDGGEGSDLVLSCEAGGFEYFRTNQSRRTNANQQRFAAGDLAFEYTTIQTLQSVPFGTSWSNVAGANK